MQKLIIMFLMVVATTLNAQDIALKWLVDIEEAKTLSKAQNKPILVYFTGSDWCGPCKRLKTDFFDSNAFKSNADAMVLLLVDMPRRKDIITIEQRKKNEALMKTYNTKGSFPNIIGLDAKGKVITEISGYNMMRDTRYHFEFLEELFDKF
ncbi:MAG: thioredoxin family protein [Flavobacteriaceae bacterium]|nr:thioredoxin family protein [Flavobacteriaceae bacterium]